MCLTCIVKAFPIKSYLFKLSQINFKNYSFNKGIVQSRYVVFTQATKEVLNFEFVFSSQINLSGKLDADGGRLI